MYVIANDGKLHCGVCSLCGVKPQLLRLSIAQQCKVLEDTYIKP